jgi:RNA polymerase sigma-70 factor (ECF subfamily)
VTGPITQARPNTDIELARRSALGDRTAQRQLFDEQRRRVHWILFRILGSNVEIEDLIQEAFLAIFRSLADYRGEASLSTWVDRIATRTAYRHLSKSPERTTRLEALPTWSTIQSELEEEIHLRDVARRLYTILDRLQPKYRIAYALHVIDGRSISEVARLTEVTLVAAKNRVWRARRMMERHAKADPVLREFLGKPSKDAR